MADVAGVSARGSLLFADGEEFIVAGDASTRAASEPAAFFQRDIRETSAFRIERVTPAMFTRRLMEEKSPKFTLKVVHKDDPAARDLVVTAIPNNDDPIWKQVPVGALPPPEWLLKLWPVTRFDDNGFTIWDGTRWVEFTRQPGSTVAGIATNTPAVNP